MIIIHGKWFDGRSSNQVNAVLKVYENDSWVICRSDTNEVISKGNSCTWKVSARLANTPRHLSFSDNCSFETSDNDGVDTLLKKLRRSHWSLWVHFLESRMRYVLVAVVLFGVMVYAGVRYGIPAAANLIAFNLPEVVLDKAGEQTADILDRVVFQDSDLSSDKEQKVRRIFQPIIDKHPDLSLRVSFRMGGKLGPYAFALPNGHIVFTDEIVALSKDNNELLAVFVHEIGHVTHRHGIRLLIQDSIMSYAILALTGDASGVSELFLGLPVFLTEMGYSREFEIEADIYALNYMRSHGIPPHHFANILSRMSTSFEAEGDSGVKSTKWTNYLSTHPTTEDRIKLFTQD